MIFQESATLAACASTQSDHCTPWVTRMRMVLKIGRQATRRGGHCACPPYCGKDNRRILEAGNVSACFNVQLSNQNSGKWIRPSSNKYARAKAPPTRHHQACQHHDDGTERATNYRCRQNSHSHRIIWAEFPPPPLPTHHPEDMWMARNARTYSARSCAEDVARCAHACMAMKILEDSKCANGRSDRKRSPRLHTDA